MRRYQTDHRTSKGRWCLGVVVAAGTAVWMMTRVAGQPAPPKEPPEMSVPVFAKTQPAKNQTGLCLIVDDGKVLGWIAGKEDFAGREVTVTAGDRQSTVIVQRSNTFTWHYQVEKPVAATFSVGELKASETLGPARKSEPTAFFVVDRTAYRPSQTLHFAGFLRQPDPRGRFVPLADREVEVRLVSRKKKTTAAALKLTSDALGRVTGEYRFSEADPRDTYDLEIPGYKGSAEVTLAEFRKAKVRLKIDGVRDGPTMKLMFQAVDFLDQPVPSSKVRFTAQVIRSAGAKRAYPLDAEEFVYHEAVPGEVLAAEALPEELRLLWEAGMLPGGTGWPTGPAVVAQRQGDVPLSSEGSGEHSLDLEQQWLDGNHSVVVEGVLTDYNGREQRAARRIAIAGQDEAPELELVLGKQSFETGEPIRLRIKPSKGTQDAEKIEAAVVVMRLWPVPGFGGQAGYYGSLNQLGLARGMVPSPSRIEPYYQFLDARNVRAYRNASGAVPHLSRRRWDFYRPAGLDAVRTMVTATVARRGEATLRLDQPGAYKLVCFADRPDGDSLTGEVGCVVCRPDESPALAIRLDRDQYKTGDLLTGEIHARYAGARVLLLVRDSSGVRLWRTVDLEGSSAKIAQRLPAGLRYGCSVEAQYLDAEGHVHLAHQMVRVVPEDRILEITAKTEETYAPGDEVKIDLEVNRQEPVDLVVSVYDQSLLGIAADRAADVRNFYLADERVGRTAALEVLRRRLAGVTVKELIERAETTLKDSPGLANTPEGEALRRAVSNYRSNGTATGPDALVLLRLAGIRACSDPLFSNYFGSHWYYRFDAAVEKESPVRLFDVVLHERDGWRLGLDSRGPVVAVMEYHPDRAREIMQSAQLQSQLWQQQGYGRGSARGDAHFSVGANAMFSEMMVSGQSFISHLPEAATAVALIDTDVPGVSVRRDFSDAAFWKADVRTDEQGKASVQFKLPDSLTNWRVVVTAVSRRMHVGQTKTSFRTFKPVMVWPMVPRIFTEGDHVELYASVHNRTEQEQEIEVSLKVENGAIHTPKQVTVRVPPKGQVPVYWTFEPKEAGFTQLLMTARCPAGSDASLKRLPVSRLAAEQAVTLSGFCKGSATLVVPEEAHLGQSVLELTLVPSQADDLVHSLDYLVQYPHGCVEQTMSRFLPAIKVAQTLARAEIENAELQKKLPDVAAAGIKRLLELQQDDGGWGWHRKGQTHEMMTPYALYGLLEAEKAGYTIPDENAVRQGLHRLRQFIDAMGENQAADRIYCTYVYAHRHDVPEPVWQFVEDQLQKGKLSDYALAMSLEMAVAKGKQDLADRLAAALHGRAQRTGETVHWTTAGFSRWSDDPLEITAAVLKALVARNPHDELIPGILTYFATTKRGNRWNSTKSTAMIIYALCDYMASQDQRPGKPRTLAVSVGDGKPRVVTLHPGSLPAIEIPGKALRHGPNRIRFEGYAPGAMYRATFRYWKSGREIAPMQSGLQLTRQFFLLDPQGKQLRQIQPGDTVPRGAYVQSVVSATHSAGGSMRYVLVENPKPSCCEILPDTDTRFNQGSTGYVLREDKTAGVVWHHEQTGSSIVDRCVLHAELAGEYTVPPAGGELMYETRTRGHSGTFFFTVADGPEKTAAE